MCRGGTVAAQAEQDVLGQALTPEPAQDSLSRGNHAGGQLTQATLEAANRSLVPAVLGDKPCASISLASSVASSTQTEECVVLLGTAAELGCSLASISMQQPPCCSEFTLQKVKSLHASSLSSITCDFFQQPAEDAGQGLISAVRNVQELQQHDEQQSLTMLAHRRCQEEHNQKDINAL